MYVRSSLSPYVELINFKAKKNLFGKNPEEVYIKLLLSSFLPVINRKAGISTFSRGNGCQGFTGPVPPPFLIRAVS
jgi:hypothetical protein